jgi:hypothetical protein
VLTRNGRFLWVADRAANRIVVVDTQTDQVVNELDLAGRVSSDPAPDLMDISPDGNRIFVALRGTNPLTANVAGVNNAVGSTPGVGILRVRQNGRDGQFQAVVRISHVLNGIERADPHAIGIRMIDEGMPGARDTTEFAPLLDALSEASASLIAPPGQLAPPPRAEDPHPIDIGVEPFFTALASEDAWLTRFRPQREASVFGALALEDALPMLERLFFAEDEI